jgi:biopolymer transport protein ExbD
MADQAAAFFDVWITDRNLVYRKVPHTVVGDWVTEGRLLEGDRVRPSGTTTWQRLVENQLLAVYLPKPEPTKAEDKAEALGDIELDFSPKAEEAEDDDVDMIPLIDISMVLLVFFMMTAQDLMTQSPIDSPKAKKENTLKIDANGVAHIGIKEAEGKLEYFFGEDYEKPMPEAQFLRLIAEEIPKVKPPLTRAIVTAGGKVPYEKVQDITIELQKLGVTSQGKVKAKASGGGEAAPAGGH